MKHLNITVHGLVQGVFFRSNTQEMAQQLGLTGFVQNESDGSVGIQVEGDEKSLHAFMEWCHNGPESAQVNQVEVEEAELQQFETFEIRYL